MLSCDQSSDIYFQILYIQCIVLRSDLRSKVLAIVEFYHVQQPNSRVGDEITLFCNIPAVKS